MTHIYRPTRRQLLRGGGRACECHRTARPDRLRRARPALVERSLQPRHRLGRSGARRLRAVDAARARAAEPRSGNARRHERRRGAGCLRDRERSRDAQIVRSGTALAAPEDAWSVHVEIGGLAPGRPYWYRFTAGGAQSTIGRTMTAPMRAAPRSINCVSASSPAPITSSAISRPIGTWLNKSLMSRSFSAITSMNIVGRRPGVRKHSDGVTATDLRTYRNRYAQYRTDPDLQKLHAQVPALMTWDDHEVQNDYADDLSETFDDPAKFLQRRAAAYRAFYEHMPVRPSLSHPDGPNMRLYDRFGFRRPGRVLGARRAAIPLAPSLLCAAQSRRRPCREQCQMFRAARPARSMLGVAQEKWLFDGLAQSARDGM